MVALENEKIMMERILNISLVGFELHGITSVILNYTSHINRENLELHFASFGNIPRAVQDDLEYLGKVYDLPDRKKATASYLRRLQNTLKSNHFDVVHIHGNSGTMVLEAALARLYGVKKIIVHCHNTTCNHPFINRFLTPIMKQLATNCAACSLPAGKWLYKTSDFTVFNNAIDLDKYAFNIDDRNALRDEFEFGEKILIGHVGHFTKQKNHEFLIDVFVKFHKKIPDSKLLLVSDGPLIEGVKQKVHILGLENAVIFAGRRADCHKLYQMMDLLVLPSKWEGLPLVTLEAQAASLPTLVSSAVTKEAGCTDLIEWMDLEQGAEKWAEKMIEMLEKPHDRSISTEKELAAAGFDIRREAEKLRELYLS